MNLSYWNTMLAAVAYGIAVSSFCGCGTNQTANIGSINRDYGLFFDSSKIELLPLKGAMPAPLHPRIEIVGPHTADDVRQIQSLVGRLKMDPNRKTILHMVFADEVNGGETWVCLPDIIVYFKRKERAGWKGGWYVSHIAYYCAD